ncbi:MAG: hypothetical protein NT018_03335 [Armatimonadetes bacterium]|nr:hypothetical protein [Armatimonadota bacterium]
MPSSNKYLTRTISLIVLFISISCMAFAQDIIEPAKNTDWIRTLLAAAQNPLYKDDEKRQQLWYSVWGMFPDAASRQEMAWELADNIWSRSWDINNWQELGSRYTLMCGGTYGVPDEIKKLSDAIKDEASLMPLRAAYLKTKRYEALVARMKGSTPESLRKAIISLGAQNQLAPAAFANYIQQLDRLDKEFAQMVKSPVAESKQVEDALIEAYIKLQRQALLQNKLFDFEKLVFVRRFNYTSSHYYTDYIDGCGKYGGNLCTLSLKDGKVTELVPSLTGGIFGHFDLSYDAQKIVFAWKSDGRNGFRLYEVKVDGTGLRQLTFPPDNEAELQRKYCLGGYHHGTDDKDPCYLPDGGICFASTRCQYGILCDAPDNFTTTDLYRIDADGGNMEQLSQGAVSEATPCVTNDGRIMYTRWEYVDKGASAVKCLWVMRTDGSGSSEIFGNDINLPPTFINGRPIPGDNNAFVVVGAPHYGALRVGTIIRLDTTKDIRTREPMTYITPIDVRGEGGWCVLKNGQWVNADKGPVYAEPFPLSASTFLVAYDPDKNAWDSIAYELSLLDEFGNNVRIYKDPEMSAWQPMPLKARPKPIITKAARNPELAKKNMAAVVVTDIYRGMEGVKRGEVKYIRINEQMGRPWAARRYWQERASDQQHASISMRANLGLKVQIGIAPVEKDGSAYFLVPADRNIFMQALDENFMEVQRERTFVDYKPGETRSCVGCHERTRETSPTTAAITPIALRREPSTPGPQPGEISGKRPLYYVTDVQPTFDKHCISCHGSDAPKGDLNLSGEMTDLFNVSYEQIINKGLIKNVGEIYPKCDNINYLPPKSLGSHVSALTQILLKGHYDCKLSREEMIRLCTWVDTNGQFYGSYYGRKGLAYKDMPDFRPIPTYEMAVSKEVSPGLDTWTTPEQREQDKQSTAKAAAARLARKNPTKAAAPATAPTNESIITGKIKHPILITDHSGGGPKSGGTKLRIFSKDGDVQWEYPTAGDTHDIWALPSGNILFSSGGAVTEITRAKQIVWQFKKDAYLTACQRLANGNTLVGVNADNQLLEVDKSEKVVKTVQLYTTCPDKAHQFRLARKLANGNYLAAHEGEGVVREYDPNGKPIKEFKVPRTPYAVVRLKNGNTLVSCGDACQVIEFDPAAKIVWQLTSEDIAPMRLQWTAGVQRLPNGNTVITCWGSYSPTTPQVLEVTRDKKIVWTFSSPSLIGATNNIVLMDVPGDCTKFEVLR